jgi:phage terminase large subunit
VDFLDYYEATGQGLTHFIDEAHKREEQRGWEYVRLVLPHDARNRVLTGTTVFEQLSEAYEGKVDVLPNISLEDGLSATRWLLERLCRFHPRCAQGVKALREYKYQFDLDRRVYSRKPVHDWTSHGADAARYVALYAKRGELLARKAPEPVNRGPRTIHDFKLDEFYELAKQPARSNRI